MSTAPIEPAVVDVDALGRAYSARFGDIYHPQVGALAQARHVFLGGNKLPQRWRGRDRWVVLETGFGLGNNFLATWLAWREDPARCRQLHFVSIEQHPLRREDLARVARDAAVVPLARALEEAWPPLTPNVHVLSFDAGRVQLLLVLGDVQRCLPQLVMSVDAFFLDGFAPAANPQMWDARVCKALGRLAAPAATAATWTAARGLRDGLTTAGFQVCAVPGIAGKREITTAVYAPAYTPRRSPARAPVRREIVEPHAVIVGAGLAGCAAAWALAEQGWRSTVLERSAGVGDGASGNPAGLFHGIVNGQDGTHARFNRAAAFEARAAVRVAHAEHGVAAGLQGLLRLETTQPVAQMRATLARLGLPADYVQAFDAEQASACAGIALPAPAWWYPGGGWVDPAALARSWLARSAGAAQLRTGVEVAALRRDSTMWELLDARGQCVARSTTVVLANAGDALALLGATDWPIQSVRGQISRALAADFDGPLPRVPVAGSGYLLPAVGEAAVFGATAQFDDADPEVREADHLHNLAQLERLLGRASGLQCSALHGRTGWRSTSLDRLPVVGAVPDNSAPGAAGRRDQPRFVPRARGLFVLTALGSRGITWSALCGQVLAASITGAPLPLEADLLDAIDPARYISRQLRRAAA